MEFIILIVVVGIFGFVFNLHGRVKKLEEVVQTGAVKHLPEPNRQRQQKTFEAPVPAVASQPSNRTAALSAQTEMVSSDKLVKWLKEDWLLKLGALLLLIGFGWLATYAFLNNWIGPMGRIVIGVVAGALFLALGWWRINEFVNQGGIFLVLGSTTILLTTFAARSMYGFFSPLSALIVMFLSTAFVALASVKYKNQSLAFISLALAGIAPLLTKALVTDYVGLFSYLFVVILGAIWIVALTGKRELILAALLLVALYSLPHLFFLPFSDKGALLLFAYAFAAVFFLTHTAGILRLKGKEATPDLITAAGNGLFLLVWIMTAAPDEWKSLIISAWMIVFAAGSFLIFRITKRKESFYVYAGVGVAMLAAATSAELKGATLTIAYAVESGLISLITYLVLRDIKIAELASLLLLGPIILSFGSITSYAWESGVIQKDFFVLLILGLILFGLGLFFSRYTSGNKDKESQQHIAALFVLGSAYIYTLLWLSLRSMFYGYTAVMASLLVYTIIGLITYFYGLTNGRKGLRLYGGALLGFVVGRLLLVDVWMMELSGRIMTFFIVGALLISTAFLGKKKQGSNLLSKN
ncbi:MAG: DUF2339 domain-containing protein [Candidatus Magasanikbacteria bacterium]|nr:DUF2339 domain-containing protein [Candidatus Magasanikbacteria bacterium]